MVLERQLLLRQKEMRLLATLLWTMLSHPWRHRTKHPPAAYADEEILPPDHSIFMSDADDDDLDVPSIVGMLARMNRRKGKQVLLNMTDYVQQSVDHYMKKAGIDTLKSASTPYCPEG